MSRVFKTGKWFGVGYKEVKSNHEKSTKRQKAFQRYQKRKYMKDRR